MAVNGLALAKFLSRAGDVVGHVLGARAGVHYFRRAPGFRQQRTDDPRVWADEFEIGGNRDRARRGQQFLLLCGSCGGAERDSTRRRAGPGSGFHVRFNQSGDRTGCGFVGFDGMDVRGCGDYRCLHPYHIGVVTYTSFFTEKY